MLYPNGLKKNYNHTVHYGNRGMNLEEDINESNLFYRTHNIGIIHKKPVPLTIAKVDFPSRREAVVREAYFKTPSTTDYNGVYRGKYIDFDAKESKSKTAFPLKNIHPHQLKHLESVLQHGGIAFLIVRFTTLDETYFLKADDLLSFIETTERKSIPITFFKQHAIPIPNKIHPRVDYLKVIDELYFKGGYRE